MIDVNNITVLVTGASHGIGSSCALFLSRAGSNTTFTYDTKEKLANKLCNKGNSVL